MRKQRTLFAALGVALGLAFAAARAGATNVIAFEVTGSGIVPAGDTLEVTLLFDFSDPTVGGGFDLVFSPSLLQFESFVFSDDLGRDPDFDLAPSPGSSADPLVIAFGSFTELSGQRTIGTARFLALTDLVLGAEPSLLTGRDNVTPAGPFFAAGPTQLDVEYRGLVAVPEPGTLGLLGSGLAAFGLGRRSRCA